MGPPAENKRRARPRGRRDPDFSEEDDVSTDASSVLSDSSSSSTGLSSEDEGPVQNGEGSGSEKEDDASLESDKEEEEGKDPLARLLGSDHTLTAMEINHRYLKKWSVALPVQDIMVEVSKQSSLKKLIIDFEFVTMSKYDVILDCVRHSASLQDLLIVNAKVNRHTANAIATALAQNRKSLQKVTFKKCTFAGSGFSILFLGVQHVGELTHLGVEDCNLQGFASEIISATLPLIKSLKSLKLVNTQLPLEGLRFLCDNLERCRNLEELDLSKNDFNVQSISWLVGCLQSEEISIKTLSLVKCGLDAACIEILARGIMEDKELEALNLANNPIGNTGSVAIINMLKENHQLTKFSVKDCKIGNKNSQKIHNALRYNNSFLKNMFSADVSLAILDSVSMMEKVPETFG
jgi:hypothetical protein